MFGIAYRMPGIVTDRSVVRNPGGFLTTTTTRLAINTADSARVRRETYVGPWLPEPVDTSADPTLGAERAEAIEAAVLVLLERLPAPERAAYILREAFDYDYSTISAILETTETNTRQFGSHAKKHLASERRSPIDASHARALLEACLAAARSGDSPASSGSWPTTW